MSCHRPPQHNRGFSCHFEICPLHDLPARDSPCVWFCAAQWEYEDEYDDSFDAYDGGGAADGVADAEGGPDIPIGLCGFAVVPLEPGQQQDGRTGS